jgi:nucleotidyltransferase AbiEii toxin of type IV toxin-antitoxin system
VSQYASELGEYRDLLRAVADWKGQREAVVEKDYYLCRALRVLASKHDGQFILKGGTSLTKGWGLLDRFSEDMDVLARAQDDMGRAGRTTLLRKFRDTVGGTPGFTLDAEDKRTRSEDGVSRSAVFRYESVTTDTAALGRNILLEAGFRGNAGASVRKSVQSIVTEYAVEKGHSGLAADLKPFDLDLQDTRRTFVEKLFAIHSTYAENHCANKMRHYYDVAQLCNLDEIQVFVGTDEYRNCLTDVRAICAASFPNQQLPPEGSLAALPALQPPEDVFKLLDRNYKNEAEIFFSKAPTLREILGRIEGLRPKL